MAREEWEDEEVEETDFTDTQIARLDRQINHLLDRMDKLDPDDEAYDRTSAKLDSLMETKEKLERAKTERVTQAESKGSKAAQYIGVASGILVPLIVEGIRQTAEMRKIKRVTKFEEDGNILSTKAYKYCK